MTCILFEIEELDFYGQKFYNLKNVLTQNDNKTKRHLLNKARKSLSHFHLSLPCKLLPNITLTAILYEWQIRVFPFSGLNLVSNFNFSSSTYDVQHNITNIFL